MRLCSIGLVGGFIARLCKCLQLIDDTFNPAPNESSERFDGVEEDIGIEKARILPIKKAKQNAWLLYLNKYSYFKK